MKTRLITILAALVLWAAPVQAQQFANANLSATGDVLTAIVPGNSPSLIVQVAGTWTGTLTFTASIDGVTFTTITATNQSGSAQATTTTANGIFGIPSVAVLRVTATSIASGTAVVTVARGGAGGGGGGAGSVTQGTSPWIVAGGVVDNGAANFTAGTSPALPVMGIYQSSPTILTDGRAAALLLNSQRALVTSGNITNNNGGAPTLGLMPTASFLATAAAPSYTENRMVVGSATLGGAARVLITDAAGAALTVSTDATHDSAASATGPQAMGVAAAEGTLPANVTAADAVRLAATLNGILYTRLSDPCSVEANKVYFPVDIVTAATTEIVNQSASNFFRLCSINLVSAGANNVAIVEDDSDTCASPTAGLNGGVTAGEGWNFAANGGISLGNGVSTVMRSSVVNRYVCIITSAAVQLSGTVVYALAP